jgi:Glycosyl transferase family 2
MAGSKAMNVGRTKRAVLSCMRNEGIWLLEWVAYHRTIGFDKIIVASNNCYDGTDKMLDRLMELGELVHISNEVPHNTPPQEAGCRLALAHAEMQDVEWVLHIDADEFLYVDCGGGHVNDLLQAVGPADVISVSWRMFGSSGLRYWNGGSVLSRFTRTEGWLSRPRAMQKCFFRPELFRTAFAHMPKEPVVSEIRMKNTAGMSGPTECLFIPTRTRNQEGGKRFVTWRNADIHHYAIRSLDVFLLKNVRGDGLGKAHSKYLQGSFFWSGAERNEVEHRGILRHSEVVNERLEAFRRDSVLGLLETEAFEHFVTARRIHLIDGGLFGWNEGESFVKAPRMDDSEMEDETAND